MAWEGASGDDKTLYRPTAILSYALERRLTGEPNALVAHVVNVALVFWLVTISRKAVISTSHWLL